MKNNKIIIIIICIISISLLIFGLFSISNYQKNTKTNKEQTLCEKIDNAKGNWENFIVIINNKYNINGDVKDALKDLKKTYSNETIYELEVQDMNDFCFEKVFEDTGSYNIFKESNTSIVIGYKNGTYVGMIQNATDKYEIERYLIEQKVINEKEIKENITYNTYQKNSETKYLLLIISDEDIHKEVITNMKKVFPDTKQDTINKNSDLGKKILKDLESKTEVLNVYPQVFYIKDNKVIGNEKVFSEKSFNNFKTEVVDIQKN